MIQLTSADFIIIIINNADVHIVSQCYYVGSVAVLQSISLIIMTYCS